MLTPKQLQRAAFVCAPCALAAGAVYRVGGGQMELLQEECRGCGRLGTVAKPREFVWPAVVDRSAE